MAGVPAGCSLEPDAFAFRAAFGGPVPPDSPRFVLAIEDDPAFCELLRIIVEGDFGATMVVAKDGEEGIELARTLLPHLILLDVILPRIDGVEVCHTLKSSPQTHRIPVIGLTASPWEEARKKMQRAGADGFVHKVYAFHDLLPLLVEHLPETRAPGPGPLKGSAAS